MAFRSTLASLVLCAALASGAVSAAATFYYDSYGGFIAGTESPPGSGAYSNDPDTATGGAWDVGADADARMAAGRSVDVTWGGPATNLGPYDGKSGFALSKVNNGTVDVDGTLVVFGTLTHFNRPILPDSDLDFVRMDWSLQLFETLADANADAGAIKTIDLTFTLYNWETPNDPAANPAYTVSYDDGATWTTVGPGVCPGSTPAGTLIVGHLGKIYRSDFTDQPGNPLWNGECGDAHIYEGSASNVYTFSHGGRDYRLDLVGFYGPSGALTQTFWACENRQCFGTVKFRILDVTGPAPVPAISGPGLVMTALLLAFVAWVALRRSKASN